MLQKKVSHNDDIILDLPWFSKENFLSPRMASRRADKVQMGSIQEQQDVVVQQIKTTDPATEGKYKPSLDSTRV